MRNRYPQQGGGAGELDRWEGVSGRLFALPRPSSCLWATLTTPLAFVDKVLLATALPTHTFPELWLSPTATELSNCQFLPSGLLQEMFANLCSIPFHKLFFFFHF